VQEQCTAGTVPVARTDHFSRVARGLKTWPHRHANH